MANRLLFLWFHWFLMFLALGARNAYLFIEEDEYILTIVSHDEIKDVISNNWKIYHCVWSNKHLELLKFSR